MKNGLIFSFVLLLSSLARAVTLTIDDVGDARLIGRFVEYCICPPDAQLEDITSGRWDKSFRLNQSDRLHLKWQGDEVYWIRLSVMNPFPEYRLRTLMIPYNIAPFWELYHQQGLDFQKFVSGRDHGATGFFPHFSVNLHPGLNQIYLKFKSHRVSLWFGAEEKVANVVQSQLTYATSMLTTALLVTLGSLAIAALLRNMLFLYYALYTSSTFIFILVSSNILMIFGLDFTALGSFSYGDLLNLCFAYELVATLLFIDHFLQLARWAPVIYKALTGFGISVFSLLIVQGFLGWTHDILLTSLILIYCILITAIFLYAIRRGVENAKKGLLSWSVYVVGIAVSSILILGSNPLTGLNLSWASMILEMLLFGFISIRELYLKQVQMSEEKEHSYKQLQKLVYPEQLELMRKGRYLEETMPVEKAEAVVLCFDIINSTRLDPDKHHAFFEDFFVSCQLLMNEGMSIGDEQVRLFRVKEMGDGFICSIGFPLACGVNQAEVSIAFVDRIASLFWQSAHRHLEHRPCGFGVGIAGGTVGGYFPRSGIMQYDLYGKAVVLATRYENMRRQLEDKLAEGISIIIVQDSIFQKLPASLQSRFNRYDLKDATFRVRDDPDAKQFWYDLIRMPDESQVDEQHPFPLAEHRAS